MVHVTHLVPAFTAKGDLKATGFGECLANARLIRVTRNKHFRSKRNRLAILQPTRPSGFIRISDIREVKATDTAKVIHPQRMS
jgi:hypothetical protein